MQIRVNTETIRKAEYPKMKDLTLNSDRELTGKRPKIFARAIPENLNLKLYLKAQKVVLISKAYIFLTDQDLKHSPVQ